MLYYFYRYCNQPLITSQQGVSSNNNLNGSKAMPIHKDMQENVPNNAGLIGLKTKN